MDPLIRRFVGAAFALASLAPTSALADPAFWRVSDDDSAIYLFGSVHILDPAVEWRTPLFDKVLNGADEVYFEMILDGPGMATLSRLAIERGFLPPGENLTALLTPEQNEKLDAALEMVGITRGVVEKMRPWLAGITVSTEALNKAGSMGDASFAAGVDSTLQAEVPDDKERGLETAEEQFDFISAGTPEEQTDALMRALDELDSATEMFAGLIESWASGDVEAVHDEITASMAMDSPEYKVLITDRNARWAEAATGMLEANTDALIVVGAAHLAGPVGLPKMLADRGFTVERIDRKVP